MSEDRLSRDADRAALPGAPDLSVFYRVRADDKHLDELAPKIEELPFVASAYVKPGPEPAAATAVADPSAAGIEAPATADFTARQGYLGPATAGVDAVWAHTQAGGSGAGVSIIDVEGAWQLSHEDLLQNHSGVIAGTPTPDLGWRNHGTAVFGEFGGDRNAFGIARHLPPTRRPRRLDLRRRAALAGADPARRPTACGPATSS